MSTPLYGVYANQKLEWLSNQHAFALALKLIQPTCHVVESDTKLNKHILLTSLQEGILFHKRSDVKLVGLSNAIVAHGLLGV